MSDLGKTILTLTHQACLCMHWDPGRSAALKLWADLIFVTILICLCASQHSFWDGAAMMCGRAYGYGSLTPFDVHVHSFLFWSSKHLFPTERLAKQWKQVASRSVSWVSRPCLAMLVLHLLFLHFTSLCIWQMKSVSLWSLHALVYVGHALVLIMIWRTAWLSHTFVGCFVKASLLLSFTTCLFWFYFAVLSFHSLAWR